MMLIIARAATEPRPERPTPAGRKATPNALAVNLRSGRVLTRCLLCLGLYGSLTGLVLMIDDMVRTRFVDPGDCEGAAMMIAVILVIASCAGSDCVPRRRGSRDFGERPSSS